LKYWLTYLLAVIVLLLLSACNSENQPTPTLVSISQATASPVNNVADTPESQADASPAPTGSVVDAATVTEPPTPDEGAPSPTQAISTSTGSELTALQALTLLKPKAVAWQADAQFGLLSNARPGQQKNLLGDALGKPDINEPTPGGKGRNWTLIAFSPSAHGAVAISMDGTQVDLVKEGAVTNDMLGRFTGTDTSAPTLAQLAIDQIMDSDKIAQAAGERGKKADIGLALMAPDSLGVGPLPTPKTGGPAPQLAYELFTQDNGGQGFILFDALTGVIVLDSSAP
jgi:hypothetical protein